MSTNKPQRACTFKPVDAVRLHRQWKELEPELTAWLLRHYSAESASAFSQYMCTCAAAFLHDETSNRGYENA